MDDVLMRIGEIIEKLTASEPPIKLHELTEDERALLLSRLACLDINLHDLHGRNLLSEALWL